MCVTPGRYDLETIIVVTIQKKCVDVCKCCGVSFCLPVLVCIFVFGKVRQLQLWGGDAVDFFS